MALKIFFLFLLIQAKMATIKPEIEGKDVLRIVERLIIRFSGLEKIMEDYQQKHNVANSLAASMGLAGGILSFTPLVPLGLGLVGTAGVVAVVTDAVDSKEYRESKHKIEAELNLYNR